MRVVVIGGGPGGTACGLALKHKAAEMGREVQVTILEGKQFSDQGHYNQCVGVLSPPMPQLLQEDLGFPFPYHLSRAEIPGYVLHGPASELLLEDASSGGAVRSEPNVDRAHSQPTIALRRVHFDAYMLEMARQRAIQVLPSRAVDVELHADGVLVYTESEPIDADLVVGAFGLDDGSAALWQRLTGYRPPNALSAIVTKYHPGVEAMAAFGPYIHAFLPANPDIEFGALTPKGNHVTINIAGRNVTSALMMAFMSMPIVRRALPDWSMARVLDSQDLRYFKGRFPCSLGQRYYGDRYVMVGDAAGLVRAFKGKGVTSAVQTGIRAAETILRVGITRDAFHHAYRDANQDIISDHPYGQAMRLWTIFLARYGLLDGVLRAARSDASLRMALFDAVSGHAPYREVLGRALNPKTIFSILAQWLTPGAKRALLQTK